MTTRTKISACPVRVSAVATPLGFKTIGSFYKFLKQCKPDTRIYYGMSAVTAEYMIRIVEKDFIS